MQSVGIVEALECREGGIVNWLAWTGFGLYVFAYLCVIGYVAGMNGRD